MEIPGLGVKLELQLPAHTRATATPDLSHIWDLHCSLLQCQILNLLSEARDQTHIPRETSWVLNLLSHNGNSSSQFLKEADFLRGQHTRLQPFLYLQAKEPLTTVTTKIPGFRSFWD